MWDGSQIIYRFRLTIGQIPHIGQILIAGLGYDGLMGYSVVSMARKSIALGMAMKHSDQITSVTARTQA